MNFTHCTIAGRITNNLELKTTTSQKPVLSFSVAVNRDKEHTDFLNCVAFGKTAETITMYFGKGSNILVDGQITTRKWTDQQGNNRTSTEILVNRFDFVDPKPKVEPTDQNQFPAPEVITPVDDDALPF